MPHLQGFPGIPVIISANTNGAPCIATLPAPAAGSRQYLQGFIISIDPPAAALTTTATITGLDHGAGSDAVFNLTAEPAAAVLFGWTFPRPMPAATQASSIVLTLGAIAVNMRVVLFGYNVPE